VNQNLKLLFDIVQKPKRNIIGLMSGTSLDGLDIAHCEISGYGLNTIIQLKNFETIPYPEEVKIKIREIFAKKTIDFEYFTLLNAWLGTYHGSLVNQALRYWKLTNIDVDIVASHGQTVYHAPKILHNRLGFPNATLQIGDGDHVAVATGIITLSDFRQKHVAAGGEGAPLAVYGDYFIFSKKGENRIMLNIGGIANFTFLPSSGDASEVFVTDTGTGNTLIDAFVQQYFPGKSYDNNAEIAKSGTINYSLLAQLKANDFFDKSFPKTTGPELFGKEYVKTAQQKSNTLNISISDLLATLTRFSAETIAEAILKATKANENYKIYLSGGGMHNPLLVSWLKKLLPNFEMGKSDELGINGDAKEAILFAILANETLCGGNTNFGNREGVPSVSFGKLSFPA
jgi:anhydro-N-acetylmuramic acid kinase